MDVALSSCTDSRCRLAFSLLLVIPVSGMGDEDGLRGCEMKVFFVVCKEGVGCMWLVLGRFV